MNLMKESEIVTIEIKDHEKRVRQFKRHCRIKRTKYRMTFYQQLRAYMAGKRKFRAVKHYKAEGTHEVRYFFADSREQAQSKFYKWAIYPMKNSTYYTRSRFYWKRVWMNCITWEFGDPKIYRWGFWNTAVQK